MGRTKNLLDGLDLSDGELEQELYLRNDFDYQWESYVKSEDYANMINDEISKLSKIYNQFDIANALQYASEGITIQPEEVGKELYDTLFSEKVLEYLNKHNIHKLDLDYTDSVQKSSELYFNRMDKHNSDNLFTTVYCKEFSEQLNESAKSEMKLIHNLIDSIDD